ncbi:MAG: WD40 repeat domain-containing protein [Alphaproteobacteria bacterium]|nr:WD40 repeat domain-containing protein [Alphaproteobacteria bacterium]
MTPLSFSADASVVAAVFNRQSSHAAFGLGDGTARIVTLADGAACEVTLTDGGILALTQDMDEAGWLAGLDDGRLVRLEPDGTIAGLAKHPGKWIEQVASSASGVRAYGAGKDAFAGDAKGFGPARSHPSTVAGLAIDPRGKRLAVAHYGGVSLWWINSTDSKPKLLPWKGSHISVAWAPDGGYVMTATQENDLHGWRLPAASDIRMSGYPTKVKALAWSTKPYFLATSGADQVICWPFAGAGPSGKSPVEFGGRGTQTITRVACHPEGDGIAAGYDSGEIAIGRISWRRMALALEATKSEVTALTWSPDGAFLAAGDDDGHMHVMPVLLPPA